MQFYWFVSTNYGNTILVRVYLSAGACDSWDLKLWNWLCFLIFHRRSTCPCFTYCSWTLFYFVFDRLFSKRLIEDRRIFRPVSYNLPSSLIIIVIIITFFLSLPLIVALNELYPIYNFQKTKKKKKKKEKIRTGRHWRHYPRELYPLPSCNAILLIEISVHHIRTVL